MRLHLLPLLWLALGGCSREDSVVSETVSAPLDTTKLAKARTDTLGDCKTNCDAADLSIPVLSADGGWGAVTTYGGTTPAPSTGGACNYGTTMAHYAAIHVSRLPGDLQGQWNGGRICGQGVRIRARTPAGWKETYARIVDKCPDDFCGIDLGGAPAGELMGTQAGRYAGQWEFVSCAGHPELYGGPTRLHVKEGSNAWWSLVHVRDGDMAVVSMRLAKEDSPADAEDLAWATEAENFFKVPTRVMQDSLAKFRLTATYRNRSLVQWSLQGRDFAKAGADYFSP
ncbi:MAG: hypothetical protein IPK50_15045 [Fibrobacterota bacterium]|nr:hypothetical protein [Fibrobacterota bacterium]QQS03609.1 MAG: hypothetical protein IPK50_15045 [Fibrobacterota bacterium]